MAAKNSAQVDIYRIDLSIVCEQLFLTLSSEEQHTLIEEKESFEASSSSENKNERFANFFDTVIKCIKETHNAKGSSFKYHNVTLKDNCISGYTLYMYQAASDTKSSLVELMKGNIDDSSDVYKGRYTSFMLFFCGNGQIYCATSGAAWQAIIDFVDPLFGIKVLSRIVEPNDPVITSMRQQGFAGNLALQQTDYRNRISANHASDFGRLCKTLNGKLSTSSLTSRLGLELSTKKNEFGASFSNSFRLRKKMELQSICQMLDSLSDLLKNHKELFSVEEWLGLKELGTGQKANLLKQDLFRDIHSRIVENSINDKNGCCDIFLCAENNNSEYLNATSVFINIPDLREISCSMLSQWSDLKDVIKQAYAQMEEIGYPQEHIKQQLILKLRKAKIHAKDSDERIVFEETKLDNMLQFSFVFNGKTYLLMNGKWYIIYDGLNQRINRELPSLFASHELTFNLPKWEPADEEDDFLKKMISHCGVAILHRKRPLDDIELCDAMCIKDGDLYLFHVKQGFDTAMRTLCGQARSSAQVIDDIVNSGRIKELEKSFKKYNSIKNIPLWEDIQKAITEGKIHECIIFHPNEDIKNPSNSCNSQIAKYELLSLIKGWTSYRSKLELIQVL